MNFVWTWAARNGDIRTPPFNYWYFRTDDKEHEYSNVLRILGMCAGWYARGQANAGSITYNTSTSKKKLQNQLPIASALYSANMKYSYWIWVTEIIATLWNSCKAISIDIDVYCRILYISFY